MITMSSSALMIAGIVMTCLSVIFGEHLSQDERKRSSILKAVNRLFKLVGVAAIVAAVIIFALSFTYPSDLSDATLDELNETIRRLDDWLDKSWMLFALIACTFLASITSVSAECSRYRSLRLGRAIRLTSAAKVVVALLACTSFVGAGGLGDAFIQREAARKATAENTAAQLALVAKIERLIAADLIQEALDEASTTNVTVLQTRVAYPGVVPVLPGYKPAMDSTHSRQSPPLASEAVAGDLSLSHISNTDSTVEGELSSKDELVDDLVDVTFDRVVSDNINEFLLHINNPVLTELVGALTDPFFADPVKAFIRNEALTTFRQHLSPEVLRQHVALKAKKLVGLLTGRLALLPVTVPGRSQPLGEPSWDAVREQIVTEAHQNPASRREVSRTWPSDTISQFSNYWEKVDLILVSSPDRRVSAEYLFRRYLLGHPDFAAIWGQGVTLFTPALYANDLKEGALNDNLIEVSDIRDAAKFALRGNADANKQLDRLGLSAANIASLSDQEIAREVYTRHGPFPFEGFGLYFLETDRDYMWLALNYFDGYRVTKWVDALGPRDKNTNWHDIESFASRERTIDHPPMLGRIDPDHPDRPVEPPAKRFAHAVAL